MGIFDCGDHLFDDDLVLGVLHLLFDFIVNLNGLNGELLERVGRGQYDDVGISGEKKTTHDVDVFLDIELHSVSFLDLNFLLILANV